MSSLHRFTLQIPLDIEWIVLGFLDPFEFYSHLAFGSLLAELEVSVPTAVGKEILRFAYKDPKNPDCLLTASRSVLPVEKAYWRDHIPREEVRVGKLFFTENVNLGRYLSLTPTTWFHEREKDYPLKALQEEAKDWKVEGPKTKILRFVLNSTSSEDLAHYLLHTRPPKNVITGKVLEEVMNRGYDLTWNEKKNVYASACYRSVENTIQLFRCGCGREAREMGERFPEIAITLFEIAKRHFNDEKKRETDEALGRGSLLPIFRWEEPFLEILNEDSYKKLMEDLKRSGRMGFIESARYLVSETPFEKRFNSYYGETVAVRREITEIPKRWNGWY